MSSRRMLLVLLLGATLFTSPAISATPEVKMSPAASAAIPGAPLSSSRSQADSLLIMGPWGSGAPFNGQFQDQNGDANWNGWTHKDLTLPEEGNHWKAHTYNAEGLAGHGAGNLAAWCGKLDYPSCNANDVEGGYGNYWDDALSLVVEVADPAAPCVVTVDAWINLNTEPGYDYFSLERRISEDPFGFTTIQEYDGQLLNQHLEWVITIDAGEYSGPGGNEVELRFVVQSDGGWSDEDCMFWSAGACQLDDITVHLDNGNTTTFDNFEDGTLGNWVAVDAVGSGDFSHLESHLNDMDDCRSNSSPQVCFVDDGVVVPGTGGTPCIDWCYGLGGFIVNWSGGLINGGSVKNAILSPVMPWVENCDGGTFDFGVYVHETLNTDSPMVLYGWDVRSISAPDPELINDAAWNSTNFLYYGGPQYRRHNEDLSLHLVSNATYVQVRLFVWDYPVWGWDWAPNGTPAPYFDNVRVTATETYGPSVYLQDVDLANDSFPASGVLDPENLATNSVRFDSGKNIGDVAQDYIQASVTPRGNDTYLVGSSMHYRLIPNPVFDPVRTSGVPNSGVVAGTNGNDSVFRFDLPDTGFFYPGDVIHYYFTASQNTSGSMETVTIPADTSGFSQNPWGANSASPGICAYNEKFSVRALPSMSEGGEHPNILIWDDACDPVFTASLRHDLNQAQAWNLDSGFDLFRRTAAWDGSYLAREASAEILAGYKAIFYFSGSNKYDILGVGHNYPLADLALLNQWLNENDERGLFVSGDRVLENLSDSSSAQQLVDDFLGFEMVDESLSPLIHGSVNPRVLTMDSSIFQAAGVDQWQVTGYCPDSRGMTAVQPLVGASSLAEFANPMGQGGSYPYSAIIANEGPNQALCFSMPYDFRRIQQLPGWDGSGVSLRSRVLRTMAAFFSGGGWPVVDMTPVPEVEVLSASAFPNPFNPSTTISFNLPHKGHLKLKIYNVRGELVRSLVDEPHEAGAGRVIWNGEDQSGGSVASGVYFYKLKFGDGVITEKMMMIK